MKNILKDINVPIYVIIFWFIVMKFLNIDYVKPIYLYISKL